jgi:hypothetical protein
LIRCRDVRSPHRRRTVIPTALKNDTRPIAGADGPDAIGVGDQEIPGPLACLDDRFVCIPDAAAEFVGAKILPDISIGFSFGV